MREAGGEIALGEVSAFSAYAPADRHAGKIDILFAAPSLNRHTVMLANFTPVRENAHEHAGEHPGDLRMSGSNSSSRSVQTALVSEWNDGNVSTHDDLLVGEAPLLIRVAGQPLTVTMRTPVDDFDLAAGFLFTEGIVKSREDIAGLKWGEDSGSDQQVVEIELRIPVATRSQKLQRNFLANSSCGLCGKTSLEGLYTPGISCPNPDFRIDPRILCGFPETLRSAQTLFGRTGGLHAAALFDQSGKLIVMREDVGRHNAVDKLIGWALMQGLLPLSNCALLASGRGGFEIIQKSLAAGIPLLASVSAASSLAVQMSRNFGMTLVGFLRGRRFVVYCGEERLGLGASMDRTLISQTP